MHKKLSELNKTDKACAVERSLHPCFPEMSEHESPLLILTLKPVRETINKVYQDLDSMEPELCEFQHHYYWLHGGRQCHTCDPIKKASNPYCAHSKHPRIRRALNVAAHADFVSSKQHNQLIALLDSEALFDADKTVNIIAQFAQKNETGKGYNHANGQRRIEGRGIDIPVVTLKSEHAKAFARKKQQKEGAPIEGIRRLMLKVFFLASNEKLTHSQVRQQVQHHVDCFLAKLEQTNA